MAGFQLAGSYSRRVSSPPAPLHCLYNPFEDQGVFHLSCEVYNHSPQFPCKGKHFKSEYIVAQVTVRYSLINYVTSVITHLKTQFMYEDLMSFTFFMKRFRM